MATLLIKLSSHDGAAWTLTRLAYLAGAGGTYVVGFVCYSVALQKLNMSVAYPIMTSIALVMVALLGIVVLNESLTVTKAVGLALIALGAFALSR
jgi:multidrug transporter EmrE-like cation transporter